MSALTAQTLGILLHGLRLRGESYAADTIEGLVQEMHQRELHHFEVEQGIENAIGLIELWDWIPEREDVLGVLRAALGEVS